MSPKLTLLAFCTLAITSMGQTVEPLPSERSSVIEPLIAKVDSSINTQRWLDAAQAFDRAWQLLDEHEDLLTAGGHVGSAVLHPGESRDHAGARSRLRLLARSAPVAFREAYAEQFNAIAQTQFKKAIQAGQRRLLMSLLSRYENVPAAAGVLRILTEDARARGNPVELALLLRQLTALQHGSSSELKLELATTWIKAGFPSEAEEVIRELAADVGFGTSLKIGGKKWSLPASEAEIVEWTTQLFPESSAQPQETWLRSQGNPAGYLTQAQQAPELQSNWKQSLFTSPAFPEFTTVLERLSQLAVSAFRDAPAGPAQPLVTDSFVIVQSVGTIQALDRRSGQLVWESGRFNRQLKSALQTIINTPRESQRFVVPAQMISNAPQNHVRGQMASDGKLLFCVEETSQGIGSPFMSTASTSGNQDFNILRVYDVASGRLRGQIGGLAGMPGRGHLRPLSSVYFLGAPLLLNDRILVLAEDAQGIHLINLRLVSTAGTDELTFNVVDRQLLMVPKYELQSHPLRRFAGITPTFGNGLIICHGCDEHVVAVDASDLTLQWVHRYRGNVHPKELGQGDPVLGNAFTDADSRQRDRMQRPHDSTARIVGSHIVIMPRDSDQVMCLDLRDGTQLWSRPRNRIRYVAGFTDDSVVLAGATGLISLRRIDGVTIWRHILNNASISAQPAATGRVIYVPTEEGQLIVLSLATGRQLLRQQLTESRLGNLTAVDGQLLIQTDLSISSWIPVSDAPSSSLASIREALLREDIARAIADLAELIDSSPSDERQPLRQMLADQLFESLRLDFTANRHLVADLQTLIDESSLSASEISKALQRTLGMTLIDAVDFPSQWASIQAPLAMQDRMEQLVVQGLAVQQNLSKEELVTQISGTLRGALTQPERDQRSGRIRRLSANHTATVISNLLEDLDAEPHQEVIRSLRPLVQQIVTATNDPSLALHQAQFCWMAGLSRCLTREQIFDRLPKLNREPFFHELLASGLMELQATATDFHNLWEAENLATTEFPGQPPDQSSGPLNDAVGRIADQLHSSRQPERDQPPQVEVGAARTARALPNPTIGSIRKSIPLYGTPGVFREWQFVRLQGEPGILAIDSRGRRRWTFDYSSYSKQTRQPGVRRSTHSVQQPTYCVALGQMLTIVEDGYLIMLDGTVTEDDSPRVIWKVDLSTILPAPTNHQGKARAWERTEIYDRQPDGLAPIGPVTEFGLPLFRGHRLVVLNPWTGSVMWFEEGLPDDSRLLAHSSRLCLLSAATGQIQVRDMRDGSVIHSDELPAWWEQANLNYDTSVRQVDLEKGTIVPWRVAMEGTRCLIFNLTPGKASLQCFDLSEPDSDTEGFKQAWQAPLSENSVYSNVSDGLVAVLQDDNHLQICQVYDGRILVDQQVTPAKSCERLYLRKSRGRLIVLTHCVSTYEAPFPPIGTVPVNGPIYAFDASTGKPAWTSASNNQSIRILNPDNAPMLPSAPLLILVKNNFPQVSPGNAIRRFVSAQVLDVNDGRVLYEEENVGRTLSYYAMRFEDDDKITVSFDKRSIVFDFAPSQPDP